MTDIKQLASDVATRLTPEQINAIAELGLTPSLQFGRALVQAAIETQALFDRFHDRNRRRAERLVADDVRQSYPNMTDDEAIAHARNTVDPTSVHIDPEGDDSDDELVWAYMVVLNILK